MILSNYLNAISGISESDKEHTHRSALQSLIESIKDELSATHKDFAHISIIHEPNNDKSQNKAGAPDFQVNYGFSYAGENRYVDSSANLSTLQTPKQSMNLKK